MTIGIAAFGPNAGLAVWRALRAVEQVGRGAIGGFASFVALDSGGSVLRAQTQRGGAAALFSGAPPAPTLAAATIAGVMSSGPDRPEPLSQFTPADGGTGLVTGHRLPNVPGVGGRALNEEVLALMRAGVGPRTAITRVLAANPTADAGIIALDRRGRLAAADAPSVLRRGDRGAARRGSAQAGAVVAVLHNAILPHRPLAALAAEVALDAMRPDDRADASVELRVGAAIGLGERPRYVLDAHGRLVRIEITDPRRLSGRWSLALGWHTEIERDGRRWGHAVYEPYLVVEDGRLASVDGLDSFELPVALAAACSGREPEPPAEAAGIR